MVKCCNCQGEIVYGTPPHQTTSNGVEEFWCQECIENYSAMTWPFDEPRPPNMQSVKQGKPS